MLGLGVNDLDTNSLDLGTSSSICALEVCAVFAGCCSIQCQVSGAQSHRAWCPNYRPGLRLRAPAKWRCSLLWRCRRDGVTCKCADLGAGQACTKLPMRLAVFTALELFPSLPKIPLTPRKMGLIAPKSRKQTH